jgi:hypothetical protein
LLSRWLVFSSSFSEVHGGFLFAVFVEPESWEFSFVCVWVLGLCFLFGLCDGDFFSGLAASQWRSLGDVWAVVAFWESMF